MDPIWKSAVADQLDASIRMLAEAVQQCPDELWTEALWNDDAMPGFAEFWYLAYHTLFWLDLYLSGAVEGFVPPAPFNLDELDPAGVLPERVYSKPELLDYLEHCRAKSRNILAELTGEQASRLCRFPWGEVPYVGLLLDNMRHVQEHGAQLRMFLGQQRGLNPRWFAS